MNRISLFICFLLVSAAYCEVQTIYPSLDFNITDFPGHWNVVGLFSTIELGVSFYSNATLDVNLGNLDILTLSFNYISAINDLYNETNYTLVPSPLNDAILVSTALPVTEFIVAYYSTDDGEAILINSNQTLGYALSRNIDPHNNNFSSLVSQTFTNLSMPLTNLTFIFNNGWNIQGLIPEEEPRYLNGPYFGNAIYSTSPFLQGLECFEVKIEGPVNYMNFTMNFTYATNGDSIYTSFTYVESIRYSNVFASTQVQNLPPLVVVYAPLPTQLYVAVTADRSLAIIFSDRPTSFYDYTYAEQALMQNGIPVDSYNFYETPGYCGI